mgnify:CR=1 FL=1
MHSLADALFDLLRAIESEPETKSANEVAKRVIVDPQMLLPLQSHLADGASWNRRSRLAEDD